MPCNYKKYPVDWRKRRRRILERSGDRCECEGECGLHTTTGKCVEVNGTKAKFAKGKVVLTIAHLDHNEENHNVSDNRLKAMCNRCHLRYDVGHHKETRRNNLIKKRKQIEINFDIIGK